MNKFIKTVKEEDVCFEFLRVMNGIMGLTNRELDVFSALVALRIRDMKDKRLSRLSVDRTSNRKEIMSKLGVTKDNMSKYIGIFTENSLIYRSREGQSIRRIQTRRFQARHWQRTLLCTVYLD